MTTPKILANIGVGKEEGDMNFKTTVVRFTKIFAFGEKIVFVYSQPSNVSLLDREENFYCENTKLVEKVSTDIHKHAVPDSEEVKVFLVRLNYKEELSNASRTLRKNIKKVLIY